MRGQTLFEIIIALAIFSMIASILVSVSLGGFTALTQGGDHTKASSFAEEGVEALRSIRDGAWNEMRPATGSQTAVVTGAILDVPKVPTGREWIFTAGAPAEALGKFTRVITLEAVCRDPQTRVITVCPAGAPDPHTERATVRVSWETRPGVSNTVTRSSYLTSWDSKTWTQTDWSGGLGQTLWSNQTRFDLITPANSIRYSIAGKLELKKSGGTWFNVPEAIIGPQRQLNGVDIVSSNDAWVVGNNEKVLHYLNGVWTSVTPTINPGAPDLRDIAMVSASDGWIVGANGELVHCSGAPCVWSDSVAPSFDTGTETWHAISMIDTANGWVVGAGGAIARYTAGVWTELTPAQSPVSTALNSIDMVSLTDGWAVGINGKIIRYACSPICAWTLNTGWVGSPPTADWQSVFMLDPNNGWAVGGQGLIYRWDGVLGTWGLMHDSGGHTWHSVMATGEDDVWVVGSAGTTGHFDGQNWSFSVPFSNNLLRDIDIFQNPGASLVGFAVGNANTVLRLDRPVPYPLVGSLVSSAFPLSGVSPVETIEWAENIPVACVGTCSVKFQVQTSANGTSWFPSQWMGPEGDDGDETDYFTSATGRLIPNIVNGRQWVRYKVELTGDGANTPTLQEVRVQYK